jgi:recombination protein RecA
MATKLLVMKLALKWLKIRWRRHLNRLNFQILYGKGINRMGEVLDAAVSLGFADKAGSWYSYKGDKIGQGKNNVLKFLAENPDIASELEARVRAELLGEPEVVESKPAKAKAKTPA